MLTNGYEVRKEDMMIKILKPVKYARQKNESERDAAELVRYVASDLKPLKTSIVSNRVSNPEKLISEADGITTQMIRSQREQGIDDDTNGKKIYAMTYLLPKKEYGISKAEGIEMAKQLIEQYPEYQSVAAISESREEVVIDVIFNNFSEDGEKMTNNYKPAMMSNIYNELIRKREQASKHRKSV